MTQSMQKRIEEKLTAALQPINLEVVNESAKHHGHMGDDGSGESHFSITISSESLSKLSRIDRQKRVYSILDEEMKVIHALSVTIK